VSCRTESVGCHCVETMSDPIVSFFLCSLEDLKSNNFLTLDPNVTGVYSGAYPFGIDPVSFILLNYPFAMISHL